MNTSNIDFSLVSQIAYEKLCDLGPDAAIDFVMQCVPGMPEDYAVAVVLGKGWLTKSEDDAMVDFTTERPEGYFKTPDLKWLCQHRMNDMRECIMCVLRNYDMLKTKAWVGGIETGNCTVNDLKFAHSLIKDKPSWNSEAWYSEVWGKISNDEYINKSTEALVRTIYVIKNMHYIMKDYEKSVQLWCWAREVCGVRPVKDVNFYHSISYVFNSVMETVIDDKPIMKKLNDFKKRIKVLRETDPFLDAAMNKEALPCDIMDGYDAGWLSPEGIFYGADGDTSSLLHIAIADELGMDDIDLERKHWIKTHHDICYSHPAFFKDEKPSDVIINPDGTTWNGYVWSKNQLEAICNYIDKFYNGKLCTGPTYPDYLTTGQLKSMDIIALHNALEH